jgi:diguanylate cyclase (GGDEF)-like protein
MPRAGIWPIPSSMERLTQREQKFAVLCFDLDRFKSVNDTLGHHFGDKLLRQVAERMRSCLREGDTLARLGGDEFAILQGNVDQTTETNALAARLNEVIGAPFDLDGHQAVLPGENRWVRYLPLLCRK